MVGLGIVEALQEERQDLLSMQITFVLRINFIHVHNLMTFHCINDNLLILDNYYINEATVTIY